MRRLIGHGALVLLLAACGGTAENTTTTEATVDPARARTDAIIAEWADAWIDADGERVAALHEPTHGVYADAAVPYEKQGRTDIARMVGNHCFGIDYTSPPAISVTYTDTGAVVQWIWRGTVITGADYGTEFSMQAQTTFEIEDGLIVRSTDDYDCAEAPWTCGED
jgi:hypothetical protein